MFVLRLVVAAALIAALFVFGGVNFDVFQERAMRFDYLALGAFFGSIIILTSIVRWQILLRGQNISLPFSAALRLTFIGLFFNLVLPGGTSGDVVKAYYIASLYPGKGAETVTTVFVDRIIGLIGLILLALAACAAILGFIPASQSGDIQTIAIAMAVLIALSVIAAAVLFSSWFRKSRFAGFVSRFVPFKEIVSRVYNAAFAYKSQPMLVIVAFLITIISHIFASLAMWFFALALGIEIPFLLFMFIAPVIMALNIIPISPQNIGVVEAAFVWFFGLLPGVSPETAGNAFWIGALGHLLGLFWGIVGALIYLQGKEIIKSSLDENTVIEKQHEKNNQ